MNQNNNQKIIRQKLTAYHLAWALLGICLGSLLLMALLCYFNLFNINNHPRSRSNIWVIIFIACAFVLNYSTTTLFYASENRKFLKLLCVDINCIKSQDILATDFWGKVQSDVRNKKVPLLFRLLKNGTELFEIGFIHKGESHYSDLYFYVCFSQNGNLCNIRYSEEQEEQFIEKVNQLNGYRDIFDVVSDDEIPVYGKKKYAKYFVN